MTIHFPQQILFPQKTLCIQGGALEIAQEVSEFGQRGIIIHGRSLENNGNKEKIVERFPPSMRIECVCRDVGEPTLDEISKVINITKAIDAEWVVGIGGGSVIDLAKAVAGLYNAKENPVFYQEGGKLENQGIPFIAVPTTAGTGAEATPNAVIINHQKKVKRSIRDVSFLAKKVILDVDLLKGLGTLFMSYAAMDAYVQGYESYISRHATWFSEVFALKAIELINDNIISAYQTASQESLSALLVGSYCAGIALSSSRLGVIHGIAHPLGVLYNVAHGLVCAACFIPSINLNKKAIEKKYERMSRLVGMDFVERITSILDTLNIISPFKERPLQYKEKIIHETLNSGSTQANPKQITSEDVGALLEQLF